MGRSFSPAPTTRPPSYAGTAPGTTPGPGGVTPGTSVPYAPPSTPRPFTPPRTTTEGGTEPGRRI
jgi:hypothetical protein